MKCPEDDEETGHWTNTETTEHSLRRVPLSPAKERLRWSRHTICQSQTWGRRWRHARSPRAACSPEGCSWLCSHHRAGSRWAESHTEGPGTKKGCQRVKTRPLRAGGVSWISQKTATKSKSRRHTHPARNSGQQPELARSPSVSLQVTFGWKEAGKYPKARWGASGIPVGGVGSILDYKWRQACLWLGSFMPANQKPWRRLLT